MPPLVYLAVRCLLGWLQFLERHQRAFVSSTALVVITGAAHCWAVVYSLFIAIHYRAMRYDGYHEGYTEHLPFWISWTEVISVTSMHIWWIAGVVGVAIRILDDDREELPVDRRDVMSAAGTCTKCLRSPTLRKGLALAHTLSCAGLFASIVMLCAAMLLMKGSITACELSLVLVAAGFALPHAVVSFNRLATVNSSVVKAIALGDGAAEAAGAEAAALGPQLCVLLALADSPGHAYIWQNIVYVVSAPAFIAAGVACAMTPPKRAGVALPPELGELVTCLVLNISSALALLVHFPSLTTWHIWALVLPLTALILALWVKDWRGIVVDFLEPLMILRSDVDKAVPGENRQRLRKAAWFAALICAFTTLWDIWLHPVEAPPGYYYGDEENDKQWDDDWGSGLGDWSPHGPWTAEAVLMLRWQQGKEPADSELLHVAAEALGVEDKSLAVYERLNESRLLLFHNNQDFLPMNKKWAEALEAMSGKLTDVVDTKFPANLNASLCLNLEAVHYRMEHLKESENKTKTEKEKKEEAGKEEAKPKDTMQALQDEEKKDLEAALGSDSDTHAAYKAACGTWRRKLEAIFSHQDYGDFGDLDDDTPLVDHLSALAGHGKGHEHHPNDNMNHAHDADLSELIKEHLLGDKHQKEDKVNKPHPNDNMHMDIKEAQKDAGSKPASAEKASQTAAAVDASGTPDSQAAAAKEAPTEEPTEEPSAAEV
eukprot:gnl/TRDRNA2_/TRDRNA2_187951_c0_seq1.p1 gnl/TRDRNA2_/TRDRNA2_187951_c0~~gnl/TRDRNA2_/TRDRNA2_187951_c0_seq1.p1  ORF type:complete len:715 (-),score=151.08 gnl/TRDRNA2_/TRDRNA2_187951_c0_seq1:57-2201(-)